MEYTYLFGPVPSRRLGVSLGVDLMPYKTCSLDCIYCECGKTTHLTSKRDEYTPVIRIKEELAQFLSGNPELDYITFSGSGEPLLHSRIREIVSFIKNDFPQYKLALLTNGTLLSASDVREEIRDIDVVKVSVDTLSEDVFSRLNRPHADVDITHMVDGLMSFADIREHDLWIEIFLIPTLNDTDNEIGALRELLSKIQPDRIHLNTMDRPGAEKWVHAAGEETLKRVSDILGDVCRVEQKKMRSTITKDIEESYQRLISTIKRRPCTADDISKIMGTSILETTKYLDALNKKGEIKRQEMSRGVFYTIK